jgi:LPXTG-motif cell wall-anchored protein
MKSHSLFSVRMLVTTLCGIGLAAGVVVFRAQADQWDKKTVLTVDQPIQVRDTYLPAGKYVFKLLNSSSDRHIVQIFNGDQSHIIDTVLAIPNYRLEPTGNSQFRFWETPPGSAKALRAWFYPGDNFGQEFPYPKHLRQVETASAAVSAPAPRPSVAEPYRETATARQEETPITQPAQPATPEPQKPVELAQAAPPPTPAATPPPQAAPPPAEPTPERLPKTGSPYPTIGLAGLVSLALYGLLRLKIVA